MIYHVRPGLINPKRLFNWGAIPFKYQMKWQGSTPGPETGDSRPVRDMETGAGKGWFSWDLMGFNLSESWFNSDVHGVSYWFNGIVFWNLASLKLTWLEHPNLYRVKFIYIWDPQKCHLAVNGGSGMNWASQPHERLGVSLFGGVGR